MSDESQGEENIRKLLEAAGDPPRMAPAARARVLDALKGRRSRLLAQEREVRVLRSDRRVLFGIALAASIMMLLAFGREKSVVHTNDGPAPIAVAMDDGTTIVLDKGSEVIEHGERHVRLVKGQAYLDVAHTGGPFVIDSPEGRAVVTGTLLVVDSRNDETRATVARGEVRLEGSWSSEILHAGDQGVLHDGRATRVPAPRVSYLTSFARQAIEKEATGGRKSAVRHGTLIARDPRGWAGEYPLAVRDFTVDAHVENGVARTTIDQTFFNHTSMQLEGVYSFPLPPGASISRLAMYIDGKLVEGGVVERQKGRNAYESIVYQRRDPALLEWMNGNVFKIRIFPLPARSEKRIILSYTQTLEHLYDTYRLAVPIPELDQPVGHAKFNVDVGGTDAYEIASSTHDLSVRGNTATFEKSHYSLPGDLLVTLKEKSPSPLVAARFDDYMMVRARPDLGNQRAAHVPRRWALLYDTSASRTPSDLEAQAYFASHLLAECDDDDTYTIVAFDRTTRVLPGGLHRTRDDGSEARSFLINESKGGVGDTDLETAIGVALDKLGPASDGAETILAYVGDGQATHGEMRGPELAKRIQGRAKFIGVTLGDKSDTRLMQSLAVATGGIAISATTADDLAWRAFDLVATLNTPRVLDVRATLADANGKPVGGAIAYAPAQLAAGESAEVIAKLASGTDAAKLVLAGTIEGKPWSADYAIPKGATGDASYLPRLWAQRRIDALMTSETDLDKQRTEVTHLGLENFVLTPYTSLLVLESDAMYRSFDVHRAPTNDWARYPAPSEIKVVYEPIEQKKSAIDLGGEIVSRQPTAIFGRAAYYDDWDRGLRESSGEFIDGRRSRLFNANLETKSKNRLRPDDAWKTLEKKPKEDADRRTWTASFDRKDSSRIAATGTIPVDTTISNIPVSGPVAAATATASAMPIGGNTRDLGRVAGGWGGGAKLHGGGGRGEGLAGKKGLFAQTAAIDGEMEETLTGAFRWSYDERLDDLSELVPALFDDGIDLASARIRASEALSQEHGSISSDARALLDRALAAQKPARFTTADGDAIVTNGARFAIDRKLASGLVEHTVYDGDALVTTYPQLELVVTRSMGAAEPALYARELPFVLPSIAPLERFYRVGLLGPHTLRMRPVAPGFDAIEIELDDSLHVIRLGDLRIEHRADAIVLRDGHVETVLTRANGSTEIDSASNASFAHVSMPLRDEGYWNAKDVTAGTSEWRDVQLQLLATYAARNNGSAQAGILRLMLGTGTLSRGALVLGSRAVRYLDQPTVARMQKLVGADAVSDYVVAGRAYAQNGSTKEFERVAKDHPQTIGGMLASYRTLLRSIEYGSDEKEQLVRFKSFSAAYPDPMLRYVAGVQMTQRWSDSKAIGDLWDELAKDPAIGWHADAAAASVLRNRGTYEQAAPRYQRAFFAALDAGRLPAIDPSFRWVITSYAGEAGYRAFWLQWRSRVLSMDDPRALASFLKALESSSGEEDDLTAALAAYDHIGSDDPDLRYAMVTRLTTSGRTVDAWRILGKARSADAELFELASRVAEHDGNLVDTARFLLRAMDTLGDAPVDLQTVRNTYARLLDIDRRIVLSSHDEIETKWAIESALDTVARWRGDDPDNADIDRRCAALLFDAHRPDEARRQLASITERHPADGQSYADVATVLESHGEDSDDLWARAVEVEPTNPTWLLRRAQNILAHGGSKSRAKEMLETIAKGKWQDRFWQVQQQAKRVSASLD